MTDQGKLLNKQQVFDKVAAHLLAQGQTSSKGNHPGGTCLYRGPNGTKCAVGCLIPDDMYEPTMEGKSMPESGDFDMYLSTVGKVLVQIVEEDTFPLLAALQILHDTVIPKHWDIELRKSAVKFNLKVNF